MSGKKHDLSAKWRVLLRTAAGWGLVVSTLALSACVGYPPSTYPPVHDTIGARELNQDMDYLAQLNKRVKEGVLTEADRERLWQAYLVRIQAEHARVRVQESRPSPIVAPGF